MAGDFDGDGHADIYAVQNSAAPSPAMGRFDGGLSQLLHGDGLGHFSALPPIESGLIVTGAAKAVAVVDLDDDGWPDFLVTRNDASPMAYRNQGVAGRHSLHVGLRGSAGNRQAIGALVTVEMTDGTTQNAAVAAAEVYVAASTVGCYFGFSDANPPRLVRVRWPDGSSSSHDVTPKTTVLSLTLPGN